MLSNTVFIFYFKENPFRKRICRVFSSDDSGNLTFDEFLLMYSIFSERAPREMKVQYAFKIYGNVIYALKISTFYTVPYCIPIFRVLRGNTMS